MKWAEMLQYEKKKLCVHADQSKGEHLGFHDGMTRGEVSSRLRYLFPEVFSYFDLHLESHDGKPTWYLCHYPAQRKLLVYDHEKTPTGLDIIGARVRVEGVHRHVVFLGMAAPKRNCEVMCVLILFSKHLEILLTMKNGSITLLDLNVSQFNFKAAVRITVS